MWCKTVNTLKATGVKLKGLYCDYVGGEKLQNGTCEQEREGREREV
jgi:hypothetical protein